MGTFVETDYTEPDIKYTLIGTAGGNDPDTGDIYRGLDRFGRIVDSEVGWALPANLCFRLMPVPRIRKQ